jgi:hypothetical protein
VSSAAYYLTVTAVIVTCAVIAAAGALYGPSMLRHLRRRGHRRTGGSSDLRS